MRLLLCALQITTATLVVKSSSMSPPLPGRHPTWVAAPLHDFDDHDHLDLGYLGIKGLSSACGTRRFLLQSQHSCHHDVATAGDISSSDSTFDLFSSLTVCGAPTVTAGDVRVYLVGYILCIIDCHICRDIFGRIDIMYYRLAYVSRSALPLRTLVLYIYRPRGTIQYNQQLYVIYSSYTEDAEDMSVQVTLNFKITIKLKDNDIVTSIYLELLLLSKKSRL
jgi:hypothetical protein